MSKLKQRLWVNEWVAFLLVALGCICCMEIRQTFQAYTAWRAASDLLEDSWIAYAQEHIESPIIHTPSSISTSSDVRALAQMLTATARPPQAMAAAFDSTPAWASVSLPETARWGVQGLAAVRLRDIAAETLSSKTLTSINIALAGSLDDVVEQLSADSRKKRLQAAHVLQLLSQIDGTTKAIIAAVPGCIEGLTALLKSRSHAAQAAAAATLANLALHPVSRKVLGTNPIVLHALMGLLESSSSAEVQAEAASALLKLAAIVPVKGRGGPQSPSFYSGVW